MKVNRDTRDGKKLVKLAESKKAHDMGVRVRRTKGSHVIVSKGKLTTCLYEDELPKGTQRSVMAVLVAMGLVASIFIGSLVAVRLGFMIAQVSP